MVQPENVDLFLESMVNVALKDERSLMEFPFFSLQKQPRMTPLVYQDERVKIEIRPGERGVATTWDKDVLIYAASIINARLERGETVERTIHFPAYDFLRTTHRGTGKISYELLFDALFRLRSTTIVTTIEAGGERERRGFGWIDNWKAVERTDSRGRKVLAAIQITLNDWMFRAIVKDRRVLTINRDYFKLGMGLERRLYELARKHCGSQQEWRISLDRLYQKCGSTDTLRKFKFRLKQAIERDNIPDYRFSLSMDPETWPAGIDPPRRLTQEKILVRILPKSLAKDAPVTSMIGVKGARKNGNTPPEDREHQARKNGNTSSEDRERDLDLSD
jgi:plasmid replication initiation protein